MSTPDLKTMLRERGLKLVDLARLVEVDKATVTRWASKEVPPERLEEVAAKSGIPVGELRPDLAKIFAKSVNAETEAPSDQTNAFMQSQSETAS
jgi:transcriptional regulator with XRE-family HTH domain